MKKIILLLACFGLFALISFSTLQAQDLSNPTFSQYHYTPFLTNPGMIGASNDVQIMFNYRRKQVSAGESFDTPMGSLIYPFISKASGNRWGGIGVSVIGDNAAGFLKTTGALLSFAYNFNLGKSNLSAGLQGGYFQRRIDFSGFSTAAQFEGGVYDPSTPGLIEMDGTSKGFATFSGGLFWAMDDEAGMQKAFLGASLMNFNQPNVSFVGDDAKLPSAFQATAGVRVVKTERFSVMPTGRYITTAGNDQINLGSWFRYHLLGTNDAGFVRQGSLGIGAWYDTNKAMVLSAEFNQPNYLISVSFDVPTSSDVNAFQRGSVFEIAAALKLNKFRPKQPEGKDTDGDGVFDETDACPETPGKKEFNGCPDTDNDGIPDNFDACPSEAGLKNFAGCPDKDNDGVQDKEDACPDVAGSKATNGCPDRDGDGVADSEDACPDQPGLKSNKGCPPAEREIVQVSPEELKILETAKYVHFETGTAVIDRTSYGILDLVVEVMKHHKEDILDLDGHTDNVGDAEKNKQLGQERADAVKAYLVSKGVAGSQITTESQGEEKPVANNETEEGRSLNRRVEMMILKKK